MLRRSRARKAILLMVVALVTASCATDDTQPEAEPGDAVEATPIRFAFDWIICEAHFVPNFWAEDNGYFDEERIDVESRMDIAGSSDVLPLLGAGEIDIGLVQASVLVLGHAEGLPVTAVGVLEPESPVAVVADAEKVQEPGDLEGLEIGVQAGQFEEAVWDVWTQAVGVDRSTIEENPAFAFQLFVDHRVDGMIWNWPVPPTVTLTEGREGDETVFFTRDTLDMYGLSLAVNNDFLEENPEAVRGFLRAYIRGAKYTLDNPTESADLVMERCPPGGDNFDRASQEFSLARFIEYWSSDLAQREGILGFEEGGWEGTKDVLVGGGLMEEQDISDLYTTDFLPDPPILP